MAIYHKIFDYLTSNPSPIITLHTLHYNGNFSSNWHYLLAGTYLTWRACEAFNNRFNNKEELSSYEKGNWVYRDIDSWSRDEPTQKNSDLFSGIVCGLGALMFFNFSFINCYKTPAWMVLTSFVAAEVLCYNSHVYAGKSDLYERLNNQKDSGDSNTIVNILNFLSNVPCVNFPLSLVSSRDRY